MPVAEGFVITEEDVPGVRLDGDTAEVRTTIDASTGCELLEQRLIVFAPGRSLDRSDDERQELLFVVSGRGTLHLEGEAYALEPDTGVFIVRGETYAVENDGPGDLKLLSVSAPESDEGVGPNRQVTVKLADRPDESATADRTFRRLVSEENGCLDVTQFVGVIPPSRAPLHHHLYDEVVYILDGEGMYHIGDDDVRLAPGTCIHLPPRVSHCLENTGENDMRVLGVFHPSGSPAAAYPGG